MFKWRFWDIWPPDVNLVRVERSPLPLSPAPPPHPPILPPSSPPTSPPPHISHILRKRLFAETVFINVFGAQELTRNEFRQPMYPELVFLKSLWGLGTEAEFIPWNRFLGSINILKYCLWGEAMRGGEGLKQSILLICVWWCSWRRVPFFRALYFRKICF